MWPAAGRTGLKWGEKRNGWVPTVLVQVLDEVGLRLELPRELLGLHEAEGALLALYDLVAFHSVNSWIIIILIRRR